MILSAIRNVTRPTRRRIAKLIFDFPEEWDHAAAQRYEIDEARKYIARTYPAVRNGREDAGLPFEVSDQWFCGNAELFAEFAKGIEAKRCLEVGSGPFGALAPNPVLRDRTIIDPLAEHYRDIQLALFGTTFFTPDIRLYARPAEQQVPELVNAVDGFIICRNCIDHCADPLTILYNISLYGRSGCWFLFWSDLWHSTTPDAGHRNITRTPEVIEALIKGLGFDVLQVGKTIRESESIEYGCVARKR